MTAVDTLASGASVADLEWFDRSECANLPSSIGVELFFPGPSAHTLAKLGVEMCRDCPVRQECLDYAVGNGEQYGTWGGVKQKELRRLVRKHGTQRRARSWGS